MSIDFQWDGSWLDHLSLDCKLQDEMAVLVGNDGYCTPILKHFLLAKSELLKSILSNMCNCEGTGNDICLILPLASSSSLKLAVEILSKGECSMIKGLNETITNIEEVKTILHTLGVVINIGPKLISSSTTKSMRESIPCNDENQSVKLENSFFDISKGKYSPKNRSLNSVAGQHVLNEGVDLNISAQPDERLFSSVTSNPASVTSNPRFKTEICRNFKEKGTCLYGDLCQFAHGKHELRKDVVRHNKYKTKLCQKYWIAGYCAYGPRCNFIHQEKEGLAAIPAHELPASVRACYPAQPALFKTAADVIGMASNINIRKSSLGDSGDSGSDEVTVGTVKPRGLQVPVFYPREKTFTGGIASNRFGYANDFTGYGSQWGSAAPIGSGRPGPRVVWPGA